MKINFSTPITDEAGTPVEGLTLASACAQALLGTEERMTGEEKAVNYSIWKKVVSGGEVELPVEDVAIIKRQLGKFASTLLYGRACEVLEG
jgi:hypothetical protein